MHPLTGLGPWQARLALTVLVYSRPYPGFQLQANSSKVHADWGHDWYRLRR